MRVLTLIRAEWREWKAETQLITKRNLCFLLIAFLIIFVGFFSIIRADFNYIDDLKRNISGWGEWGINFFRWLLFLENYLLQFNIWLADASPLNQFVAMAILACCCVLTAFILTRSFLSSITSGDSKFTGKPGYQENDANNINNSKKSLDSGKEISIPCFISSLAVAFNPYFLECISYKYESVGMATSIFLAIIPFLFLEKKHLYLIVSFFSILLMALTYQASAGIYIILVIVLGLIKYLKSEEEKFRDLLFFYIQSAFAFILPLLLYYFCALTFATPYRDVSIIFNPFAWANNYLTLIGIVLHDFNPVWLILVALCIVLSAFSLIGVSQRPKLYSVFLVITALLLCSFFCIGPYIALKDPTTEARMIYGVGFLIALFAIFPTMMKLSAPPYHHYEKILVVPSLLLTWCFFVCSFVYGNSLSAQKDYEHMYETIIIDDLIHNVIDDKDAMYELGVRGTAGISPAVLNSIKRFPVIDRLVPSLLDGFWIWSGYTLTRYYLPNIAKVTSDYNFVSDNFELLVENAYYKIWLNNENIIIVDFK